MMSLARKMPVEKTENIVKFKTFFMDSFDFERIGTLAAQVSLADRCGSRSLAWKVSDYSAMPRYFIFQKL